MTKRLISFLIALCLLIAIPLSARYKYNPFTRKLDYYEPVSGSDLGDLGDVTLTGLATGNVLYYNGTAWVNLATGANAEVLTLAAGIPSWAAPGAPVAHAASHEVGGADLVDHDQLTNYLAAQHLTLPNTIVAVLTDHNKAAHDALLIDADTVDGEHAAAIVTNARVKAHFPDTIANVLSDHNLAAHTALGLFDQSSDVDHNATTNYFIYNHVGEDHLVEHTLWIGWLAGQDLAAGGEFNTLVGEEAGANITTGDYNTALGYQSAQFYLTGEYNTTVGWQAGTGVATNNYSDNTFIGAQAGFATTTGSYTVVVGSYALNSMTTAWYNVVVGAGAASALIDGANNTVIGSSAGVVGTTYDDDVFIGMSAAYSATTAEQNVVVGNRASYFNQTGGENVVVGYSAAEGVITKSYSQNVIVGTGAGFAIETGGLNVIIGYQAAEDITDGASNIVIGYMAGEGWLDTENEKLVIDVTDTTTPLIYGDFNADNITINGDFNVTMDAALDQIVFAQSDTTGTDAQPLIFINDDRTGTYANTKEEATIRIDADGTHAMYLEAGGYYQTDMNFNIGPDTDGYVTIGRGRMGDLWSDQFTIAHVDNYAFGTYILTQWANGMVAVNTGTGTTGYLRHSNANVASWSATGFGAVLDFTAIEDVFFTWADAADHMVVTQNAVAGTEDQPLIFIDDNRVGDTVDEDGEASLVINGPTGLTALYLSRGYLVTSAASRAYFGGRVYFEQSDNSVFDDKDLSWGTHFDFKAMWDSNGAGDDLMTFRSLQIANSTAAIFYSIENPTAMTDHDDYLSPTFVLTNSEGADVNDYSGVVIGERTQNDVAVAHYFDFFAMTGSADGSVDGTTAELAAIFRFGASGSDVPDNATTPGDVLFEGNIEVNGMIYSDGGTSDIKVVILKVVAFDVAIPAGNEVEYITIPPELNGFDLVSCGAHVYTASDTGAVSVQIHNLTQTADMLTTNITIDQDELDSKDAAAPPVIDGTEDDVATGDALRIDVDGAGANGKGLEIRMGFRKVV